MLRFVDHYRHRSGRITRRAFLSCGALGTMSAAWMCSANQNAATAAETSSTPRLTGFGRAKSVILVFANGGQSQIDTWDPKPAAPLDVRGAFQPIATAIPGVQ